MKEAAPRSHMAIGGLIIIGALAAVAVFAPLIAPYPPAAPSGAALQSPSWAHPLGTNDIGADILSQLIWGTRMSLEVAVPAAVLATAVGALVGTGAGLLGGRADQVAARVVDASLALPILPLLILLAAFAGSSPAVLMIIIAAMAWPETARIVRGQTLTLRQRGYLSIARGFGTGPWYLMRRHVLPALAPILVVAFVTWAGTAVVLQAALAFLGIGDPASVSWGMIINRAMNQQGVYISDEWTWLVLPAGLAITVAVMGFALIGVGLETSANPRWSRTT